jgi:hypothetical protein
MATLGDRYWARAKHVSVGELRKIIRAADLGKRRTTRSLNMFSQECQISVFNK